jgi:hypothetical protein
MTDQEILKSREVRMINIMIDSRVQELVQLDLRIKGICTSFSQDDQKHESVRTRIHQEDPFNQGGSEIGLYCIDLINRLPDLLVDRARLKEDIRKLNVTKLNLLNDYDFTGGDDSFQKSVFGDI